MDRPVTTFTIGYEARRSSTSSTSRAGWRSATAPTITRRGSTARMRSSFSRCSSSCRTSRSPTTSASRFTSSRARSPRGTTVVQVGEGADENFLGYWWCEHYRQEGGDVYAPARKAARWWRLPSRRETAARPHGGRRARSRSGREGDEELFWGGAVCWWGEPREQLTPIRRRSRDRSTVRSRACCRSHRQLDSHAVVRHYVASSPAACVTPEVLQKIPYLEMRLRLPEHLLMRVDKLTMAHSIEARVPFLDHDLVEFSMRLPRPTSSRTGSAKRSSSRSPSPTSTTTSSSPQAGLRRADGQWFQEPTFRQELHRPPSNNPNLRPRGLSRSGVHHRSDARPGRGRSITGFTSGP